MSSLAGQDDPRRAMIAALAGSGVACAPQEWRRADTADHQQRLKL
jgi:hypothetical protein